YAEQPQYAEQLQYVEQPQYIQQQQVVYAPEYTQGNQTVVYAAQPVYYEQPVVHMAQSAPVGQGVYIPAQQYQSPPQPQQQQMSRRLAAATRTVVEVVVERRTARPPARSTAERLAAAAETARSWRARVTECADQAYDAERGRIDWEAVAAELRLPLIGCLHMFDASLSAVAVRRLPGPADWSKDDVRAMAGFVADNFGTLAGDIWRMAGVYMNTTEADCLAAYRRLKDAKMTDSVYESIQKLREDGVSWRDIHKIFPVHKNSVVLQSAFRRAKGICQRVPDTKKPPTKWTQAETERIREISTMTLTMHHADAVNQEVQRQYESGLGVDWAAVSRAVGLSEIKCLELCRFSEGKVRWTYDPDTFSQETADRMEAFIAEHYPPPAAPNFNAVSNYMWIDINDCIRMTQLLRGEFEWTDEAKARMIRMRERGMSYKEIARQLSPNLTADSIKKRISNMKRSYRPIPLTPEEKQRIMSIVDKNSGKMSFRGIAGLVNRAFVCPKRRATAFTRVNNYSASLPLYKARAEAADKDQIARDILSGTTTTAEAARRLDVPNKLVVAMVGKFQSRMYSNIWTDQEMEQLLEYTRTHTPPYNWRVFSALLGTKSQLQCRYKYGSLKSSGLIPGNPEK
ncbi:hypothetical protein H4R18_004051, partial [Coemansia javaensis]